MPKRMPKKIIIKVVGLALGLVLVFWLIQFLDKGTLPKDRNEYISERNKRICQYDIKQINIVSTDASLSFEKAGSAWVGGGLSDEFIKTQVEEFCNLKVNEEANLDKLKGDLVWIEDLEIVFVDDSSINAKLSQNGVIQVGVRYYFVPSLLKLIQSAVKPDQS